MLGVYSKDSQALRWEEKFPKFFYSLILFVSNEPTDSHVVSSCMLSKVVKFITLRVTSFRMLCCIDFSIGLYRFYNRF